MTTIRIEIDTNDEVDVRQQRRLATSRTTILASTIHMTQNPALQASFVAGAGFTPIWDDGLDYDHINLTPYNNAQYFVVTAGGSITHAQAAAQLTNTTFVSAVGTLPTTTPPNCYGGVNLHSQESNINRVQFLAGKGRNLAAIGLFCNRKSRMNAAEETTWKGINGVNHNIAHGGNDASGHNDSSHYLHDLNAADPAIKTLVISADPFFFDTRNFLITACNQWLQNDNTRCVCYPLADYQNPGGVQPDPNYCWFWYGPALSDVYNSLGKSAAAALMQGASPQGFTNSQDGHS